MIKSNKNVNVMALNIDGKLVITLIEHENGGLSQGDGSSATAMLEITYATTLSHFKSMQQKAMPLIQTYSYLKRASAGIELPPDVAARRDEADVKVKEFHERLKAVQGDLADIQTALKWAKIYDESLNKPKVELPQEVTGTPSSVRQALADSLARNPGNRVLNLMNFLFGPQFEGVANTSAPEAAPAKSAAQQDPSLDFGEDMILGCGNPDCSGCSGQKMFKFDPNNGMAGMGPMGYIDIPFSEMPTGLPPELKAAMQSGDVHVIELKPGEDPIAAIKNLFGINGDKPTLH